MQGRQGNDNDHHSGEAMTEPVATSQTILVVGGGISGMTAALEAAECGHHVVLVEREPALGGRTARLYRYFPKMCHPTCGLEINLRRLKANRNVQVMTMTDVVGVGGKRGATGRVSIDDVEQLLRENRRLKADPRFA